MSAFSSSDELYQVMVPFYEGLTTHSEVGPKFAKANTSFRLVHHDPEATFVMDATQNPAVLTYGEAAQSGEVAVELTMSADDGHKFWLGKLNLPVALARRKVKVKGNVASLLGILPALQPAYAHYRAHLESLGRPA